MSDFTIRRVNGQLGVDSWTEGFKPAPAPKLKTDRLRHLIWLERHGHADQADLLLERYCSGRC